MSDATRQEVIQWCIDNKVNFVEGRYPPPEGWGWYKSKDSEAMSLCAVFSNTEDEDVDQMDVLFTVAASMGINPNNQE